MRKVVFGASLAVVSLLTAAASPSLRAAPQSSALAKILADARQALGGEARLSAVKTFILKGDEWEIACELPDKFVRTKNHGGGGGWGLPDIGATGYQPMSQPMTTYAYQSRVGFNGDKAIFDHGADANAYPSSPLTPAQLREQLPFARQAFVDVTLGLFATSFSGVPLQFLDAPGTENGTEITVRDKVSVIMRFDPITHLPAALGTLEYSDYRDVGGLTVPFKIGRMVGGLGGKSLFVGLEIKQARFNVRISHSVFENK